MSYPAGDSEWHEGTVSAVDGRSFQGDDGWWLGFDPDAVGQPTVGGGYRIYGTGIGSVVRGIFFDRIENRYQTVEESRESFARQRAAADMEKQSRWECEGRAAFYSAHELLPEVFRLRLDRFKSHLDGFGWKHGAYEMSCCVDAVKIATACETPESVIEFGALGWPEQQKRVPGLFDGHSGNTFGMAVRLAHHYLTDPTLVWREHAAMSALLGCEGAGCPPVNA